MTNSIQLTTQQIITTLANNGKQGQAILAGLRGAPDLASPRAQAIWPLLFSHLDKQALSRNGKPTAQEQAIYAALRLYAIHQQGHDQPVSGPSRGDNATGVSVFSALATMRQNPDFTVPLDRRVQGLLKTANYSGVVNELTHLINQIKARTRSVIDYPALAQDLFWFQRSYESSNRIRLQWGQAYYHVTEQPTQTEGK